MRSIWFKLVSFWSILAGTSGHLLKEPLHGVHGASEVMPGNEIIIRCCGDVWANGVPLLRDNCDILQADGSHRRISAGDAQQWTNQDSDTPDPLSTNHLAGDALTLQEATGSAADEAGLDWSSMSQWTLNGQQVQDISGRGGDLKVPKFGLDNVGNYSCYQDGKLMSTVTLTLRRGAPERPVLNCRRRAPELHILCDCRIPEPVSSDPQCHLTLQKMHSSKKHMLACNYSSNHSRCQCLIRAEAVDETAIYVATLNITQASGSHTYRARPFYPEDVFKPDPPVGLEVRPVVGEERRLLVTWHHPEGWGNFYGLEAELRYRPKGQEMVNYQLIRVLERDVFSWTITDAQPHMQYEVQARLREEHGKGNWSDWSSPVSATTWTAPGPTESLDNNINEVDILWLLITTATTPRSDPVQRPDIQDQLVSIICCCVLGIVFLLVFIPVFRQRTCLKSKLKKMCFASPAPGSPVQVSLCQPKALDAGPADTRQPEQATEHAQEALVRPSPSPPPPAPHASQVVHFDNASYFLIPTDQ